MIRSLLSITIAAALAACSPSASAPPPATSATSGAPSAERAGTVVKITDAIWAITPADQPTTRYCFDGPLATPALRVDGKKLHFSGTVGAIPPNARLACTPFTLGAATAD